MRPYEIMLIIDSTLDDAVIASTVDRSAELLKNQGGSPGRVERWGRRKLAYEINKKTDGYYVLMEATGVPANMAELDHQYFLTDEILRHKIIAVPAQAAGRSMAAPPTYDEIPNTPTREPREGGRDRGDRGDRDRDRGERE